MRLVIHNLRFTPPVRKELKSFPNPSGVRPVHCCTLSVTKITIIVLPINRCPNQDPLHPESVGVLPYLLHYKICGEVDNIVVGMYCRLSITFHVPLFYFNTVPPSATCLIACILEQNLYC
jgi:hypothetical protein